MEAYSAFFMQEKRKSYATFQCKRGREMMNGDDNNSIEGIDEDDKVTV